MADKVSPVLQDDLEWNTECVQTPLTRKRSEADDSSLPSKVHKIDICSSSSSCVKEERKDDGGVEEEEDDDERFCWINKLPSEVLNYIFSFLDFHERMGVEQVCSYWKYVNTTFPWVGMYSLNFSHDAWKKWKFRVSLDDKLLHEILTRCGSTLRTINVSGNQQLSEQFAVIISEFCPNLESVNLEHTKITNEALKLLGDKCKKLKCVNLASCQLRSRDGTYSLRNSFR